MTGHELFSKIINHLNLYLEICDEDVDDLINIDENLEGGIQRMISLTTTLPEFHSFLTSLNEIRDQNEDDFLITPYSNSGDIYSIDFSSAIFDKKNRRIAHTSTELTFVSSSTFFDNSGLIDFSLENNKLIWKAVEEFLERIFDKNEDTHIDSFFDVIKNNDTNKGLLVYRKSDPYDEENVYSYAYLSFLNSSKSILIPNDLKYAVNPLVSGLNYSSSGDYKQYFDIYDVLNELNQAPDILNRYLRLYHMMEYLVYRVYLVNLVSRVGTNKFFVREFIVSAESMKKGEKEAFKKNFKEIFSSDLMPTIEPNLSPVATTNVTTFLADKNIVKGFTANDISKVSELIYGLRCCIVHNKESEYHLTLSNFEEYQVIIPLIKKILETFEGLIINKMISNHSAINYPQQSVKLY